MKSIHELLILLLEEFTKYNREYAGLCIAAMLLSDLRSEEEALLLRYISKYASPNIFESRYYCTDGVNGYYWPKYEQAPRIEWLEKHIKLTAPKS